MLVNGTFPTEGILEDALFLAPQMNIERSAFSSAKHIEREKALIRRHHRYAVIVSAFKNRVHVGAGYERQGEEVFTCIFCQAEGTCVCAP